MKQKTKLKEFSADYFNAVMRFPLMVIFLLAAFITNTIAIYKGEDLYDRLVVTFLLGACIYSVLQLIYERFYTIPTIRYFFMGVSLVLSFLYYLIVGNDLWKIEITVKTLVLFFILLIAFIWVPSIKSRISFNESFMAAFKAFFVTAFFYLVLFLGVVIVIGTTNLLLINVQEESYAYAANLIFILLAPIHFMTLIPYYPNKDLLSDPTYGYHAGTAKINVVSELQKVSTNPEESEYVQNNTPIIDIDTNIGKSKQRREEALIRLISPVKFLEALISYVIIPLTAVFTIILLLYIIMNITGEFWTDNLMEPLLVSYSITVIIVYLLASTIHNTITRQFRKIFPKVLVIVVLFQTISSIIRTAEIGFTYGRYYAIMFGVFATIAGVIFSVKPVHNNGLIAPVLIILSLTSILPYIDAFTISKLTQINRLENTLEKNNMFDDEKITPKANISEKDKKAIIASMRYLNEMDYTGDIKWLRDYTENYNFEEVFGFEEYEQVKDDGTNISVYRKSDSPIPITGYDFMIRTNLYEGNNELLNGQFDKDDISYQLKFDNSSNQAIILESNGSELIRFDTDEIYDKYVMDDQENVVEAETEEVTFTEDNSSATLTIVADHININVWQDGESKQADIYILVKIK